MKLTKVSLSLGLAILKHDETFAVLNDFGNIIANHGSTHGLYHRDTRYLSRLELRLNGKHPLLLSSSSAEDGLMLPIDLANTDTRAPMVCHYTAS